MLIISSIWRRVMVNGGGTANLIEFARTVGAERFVLISTDKAAVPSSIMGATKKLAELLVRTFGYTNPDGVDYFGDDEGSAFEVSINKLRAAGVTFGCNPPDNDLFCPLRSLTRGEMATFLARALGVGA